MVIRGIIVKMVPLLLIEACINQCRRETVRECGLAVFRSEPLETPHPGCLVLVAQDPKSYGT